MPFVLYKLEKKPQFRAQYSLQWWKTQRIRKAKVQGGRTADRQQRDLQTEKFDENFGDHWKHSRRKFRDKSQSKFLWKLVPHWIKFINHWRKHPGWRRYRNDNGWQKEVPKNMDLLHKSPQERVFQPLKRPIYHQRAIKRSCKHKKDKKTSLRQLLPSSKRTEVNDKCS